MGSSSYFWLFVAFVTIILLWAIHTIGWRRAFSFIGRLLHGIIRNWQTTLAILMVLVIVALLVESPSLREALRAK